jgi:hypothetical protein
MVVTNLDIICRRWLLERSLPIHFYSEALYHSATCLQLLTQDTLQVVNSANLPVDSVGNVMLPDDFDEDLSVCIPSGQALVALPKQDWITPLRIHDTTSGDFVKYNELQDDDAEGEVSYFGFTGGWSYYWNIDAYGGFLGRQFGSHGGTYAGYKVFREQRRIQMTEGFANSNVVLLYISDGQSVDNASQIDTKATQCIKSYIDWQRSPNATNEKSPEGRTYYNQKRRLKTLLNPLTKADIVNIFHQGYTATIKK